MVGLPNKTSRIRAWPAFVLVAALVAVACGGSEEEPASVAAPEEAAAFPVTIEHRHGSTTIEAEPTRVVTVGLTDQDAALALGVVPIGTSEWFGNKPGAIWPWAEDELGDAEVPVIVSAEDGPNFERIASLRPDLILAVYEGMTESQYRTLSQIAPTVAQPDDYVDFGVPWQDQTRIIGKALGRSDKADEVVASVEADFDRARKDHPEFEGATAVVATVYDGKLSIYSPQDARGRLLQSLGFVLPPELEELAGKNFSADVSLERVDLIDGDAVVWLINDKGTDIPQFEANSLYAELDVHTEGRDVFLETLSPVGAATSFITPLSLPFLIDGVVPLLAAAVDGDPKTT